MLRVALISHLSEISGACVALLGLAEGLRSCGMKAELVLPGEGPLAEESRRKSIEPVVIPNPQVSMLSGSRSGVKLGFERIVYVRSLSRWLRDERIDVVYVNTTATIFPGVAARFARRPIVWHVHETLTNPGRATRVKMRFIEMASSAIIYASRSGETAFPAPRVKQRLIARNVVCLDALRSARERLESRAFGPPHVVLMNGLYPLKGADIFLRAAARVQRELSAPVRFVLLGSPEADPVFASELKRMTAELGLEQSILFAGLRSDMPDVFASADVFVSASRTEAMPMAIVEAMATGTPVIATEVGDCPELLDGGRLGTLVPSEDPDALARAIVHTLSGPEATRAKAALAQAAIIERYSTLEVIRPVETLLLAVAEARR